ncbi:MAG: hypothetical protein LBE81_09250 [Azonexus sp.]|jgi:hypothetical protein|uniref:hypothetical protein n=1 Tax=Azonexus sp. TaxID=1872668 RepID=UPI0028361CC5|nr:hypothetical protein [Azonexus sp.]MDR0776807.1 hypothetical protein [Azonexus sp.]
MSNTPPFCGRLATASASLYEEVIEDNFLGEMMAGENKSKRPHFMWRNENDFWGGEMVMKKIKIEAEPISLSFR